MPTAVDPTKLLKGLFDRPINPPIPPSAQIAGLGEIQLTPQSNLAGGIATPLDQSNCNDPSNNPCDCPLGYYWDASSQQCLPLPGVTDPCGDGYYMAPDGSCQPVIVSPPPITTSGGGTATASSSGGDIDNITANITNQIAITDTGIAQVATQVQDAIQNAANTAASIAKQAVAAVGKGIANLATNIWNGIQAAFGNIGQLLSAIASTVWNNLQQIFAAIGTSLQNFLQNIKDFLTPIIQNIATAVDAITKQIQTINDTLIKPIANLYTSTIGTIATLTTAIEKDLHDGLSGILQIPTDIANGLGSLDATLQRTVQQLGTVNSATSQSTITFAGETLPTPFGAAMASALGGKVLPNSIKTTFNQNAPLSSETLQQVSAEAISGLGSLLSDILNIVLGTFKGSLDQLHTDWTSVGSLFVGLLDGFAGLLTTLTAMGAIANPLLDAASQRARTLVPTAKLDPATVIEAMKRGFVDVQTGIAEIGTTGLDATRTQVLQDLGVFLADVNTALDWWYRGIIQQTDLAANMSAHGITNDDQQALIAGSVRLPSLEDLIRWLNFGIITQDEFTSNVKILRYDDAQVSAILQTYQQREPPELRSELDGLLNNSAVGFLNSTLNIPVPDSVNLSGARAGYHPDYIRYIWLAHWQIPGVDEFIQAYFRGFRTLTEVQERLAIANIPKELWADVIQVRQALIPFRSLAAYVKAGVMSQAQARQELAAHGFDLNHVNIISNYLFPSGNATTAKAATTVHTLSISNARTLWGEGALSDEQYTSILVAHGYTTEMAAAQLKADGISELIKTQKQTITDFTAQVEAGIMTLDDAIQQLTLQGFTSAQVAKFQLAVTKAQKINVKLPSYADLKAFLKAGVITLDVFTQGMQALGWADPWLSYFVALETPPPATATGA